MSKRIAWLGTLIFLVVFLYVPSRYQPQDWGYEALREEQQIAAYLPTGLDSLFPKVENVLFDALDFVISIPEIWELNPNLSESDKQKVNSKDDFKLIGQKAKEAKLVPYFQSMYGQCLLASERLAGLIMYFAALMPFFIPILLDAVMLRKKRATLLLSPRPAVWRGGWVMLMAILFAIPTVLVVPMTPVLLIGLIPVLTMTLISQMVIYYHRYL